MLEEGLGLEAEKILSLSFGWEQTPRLLCTSSVCYGKPGLHRRSNSASVRAANWAFVSRGEESRSLNCGSALTSRARPW